MENDIYDYWLSEQQASKSEDQITNDIIDFIDNFYEFDEEIDEYEDYCIFLLDQLAETFLPNLLELDYKRTGNVLFLWELISTHWKKDENLSEFTWLYLKKISKSLLSESYPSDVKRYHLICDQLSLSGGNPFKEYIKEKRLRIFLAEYYWILLSKYISNGIPELESGKNRLRVESREQATNWYKDQYQYDDKTYYNWVMNNNFSHLDFLYLFGTSYIGRKLSDFGTSIIDHYTPVSYPLIIDLFRTPQDYSDIFEEL